MLWRNVHTARVSELDLGLRDAACLSGPLFRMIYGLEVYRVIAPDNSIRLSSFFAEGKITPEKKGERISPPKWRDKVVIIEGYTETFGQISSVDEDDVRIWMYKTKDIETYSRDCLETSHEKVRWRIVI